MLVVHHLGKSQSERIVWLCEELAIPYQLQRYDRDPATMGAPAAYKAVHPLGAAPVVTDGEVKLAESGAIVEYILNRYGKGRLTIDPSSDDYPAYLYWLHFSNGTLQPSLSRNAMMKRGGVPADSPFMQAMYARQAQALGLVEERLGKAEHLAGNTLTAADIMMVFTLTTMRYFAPFDLAPYPAIRAYLQRIGDRPAYRVAMAKGDPDMALLLT